MADDWEDLTGAATSTMSTDGWIDLSGPVAPVSNAEQVGSIVAAAPENVQAIVNQAIAIRGITRLPWEDAFQKATVLTNTTLPKPKKLGEAIADRFNAERLTVRIGQIGNDARKAYAAGDEAKYKELVKQYETLSAQLPNLEDTAPAYDPNLIGSHGAKAAQGGVGTFLRNMAIGGVGLVGQQLEMIAGEQQQGKLTAMAEEAKQEPFFSLKGLAAPWAAMMEQGKQGITGTGEVEGGSAFMDLVKAGVDPGIADRFASGIGAINNVIELAQVATLVKMFPGAEAVISKASSSLVRKLLLGPALRNKALRLTVELAKGTAEQMAQEIAQEAVTFYGENWAIEVQNATKGTALEGNADFMGRVKSLVTDFLPGVLALGALPIGMRAFGREGARETAAPKPVEPTPMDAVRTEVAQAETPEAKATAIAAAETAKTQEIASAEVLTPAMVQDVVELADMEEEPVQETTTPALSPAVFVDGEIFTGDTHGEATNKAIDAGKLMETDRGYETTSGSLLARDWADLFVTPNGELLNRFQASERYNVSASEYLPQHLVESGQWVPDLTLGQFSTERWAKSEIANREDLRDVASYLADSGQATSFETFLTAAKEMEVTPKSEDYYRNIWDTAPKADVAVDEDEEATTEAHVDSVIAAEETQVKKAPLTDRLLADIQGTPMYSGTETVKEVLDAKPIESKAVEGEEFDQAALSNDLLTKKQRMVKRMSADILRKPSAGIGGPAVKQIRDIQAPYIAKETTSLNKAKKAIKAWQDKHPGAPLIKEAQDILNRRSIKDLSVGELIDLWKQSREIRQKGAEATKAQREATKARRVQMATDMLADIPGGVVAKRMGEFASEATKKQERKLARKGKLKSNVEHPLRIFQSLGPAFKKYFWDQRKTWEGREIAREVKQTKAVADLMKQTGVTATEMLRMLPGTDYYIDDLMTYYGQMKDPNGRKAVLWGNDEDEAKITQTIGKLTQKYKDFVDGVMRLNGDYSEVENVQIRENGQAAPKVDNYLPIRREGDFGKPFSEELSTDAGIRASARMASLSKGFTNARKTFKEGMAQSRIRTDFLNILTEQIAKESKYVEGEQWARDMGWLLGGKSKESKQFLEAVKQKHGQPIVTMMKDYANAVVKPESFNGLSFNGLMSRIFRNMSDAQLMYKLATVVVQVEGPFRALSQLDFKQWHYLAAGLWKASTSLNKTAEMVYQKSPVMRAMAEGSAIDPALQEGRGLKHSRSEIALGLQKAHQGMRKGGYFLLTLMNKWTVIAEWTSKYYAELAKTGEEGTAVQAADDAVYTNQPSGNLADAPRMYWTAKQNMLLAFLQRFSRASNQMGQMLTVDLWRDLKQGHMGKALGVVLAFAIGAYINALRTNKRPPKDAEEYLKVALLGATDALGAMSFGAVSAAAAPITGGYTVGEIKPLESFRLGGEIAKDVYYGNVSTAQVKSLISTVMQMTGMPFGAAENIVRSAYDFETEEFRFDPVELFGRRPRE